VADTVEFLLQGPGDPFVRLEQVLAGHPHKLPRLGIAGYACLMHLWDRKRFAIFNKPVMVALKALKVRAGSTKTHRVAARYRNLCGAMQKLTAQCGLKNLSRADRFFDGIGKKHFRVARQ
jgi:hypothetical protein